MECVWQYLPPCCVALSVAHWISLSLCVRQASVGLSQDVWTVLLLKNCSQSDLEQRGQFLSQYVSPETEPVFTVSLSPFIHFCCLPSSSFSIPLCPPQCPLPPSSLPLCIVMTAPPVWQSASSPFLILPLDSLMGHSRRLPADWTCSERGLLQVSTSDQTHQTCSSLGSQRLSRLLLKTQNNKRCSLLGRCACECVSQAQYTQDGMGFKHSAQL